MAEKSDIDLPVIGKVLGDSLEKRGLNMVSHLFFYQGLKGLNRNILYLRLVYWDNFWCLKRINTFSSSGLKKMQDVKMCSKQKLFTKVC